MTQPTAAGPSNTPIPALNNDNNNSTYNTASGGPSQPLALQPGTFQSLIPMVDDIFSTLYQQSISGEKVSTALAAEQVAPKAKQLAQALETMKSAAVDLPGGHLSTEDIRTLTDMLEEQGQQRREVLRAFEERSMPLTDQLGGQDEIAVDGEMSSAVLPSPAGR